MDLVDWAARWDPVPDERPCQVALPGERTAPTVTSRAGTTSAPTTSAPRSTTITLRQEQADDLPLWLPRLLAEQDVRPGDRVTVALSDLAWVPLTGLELLMTVLWRRVGPHGEVLLVGGTPGLRAQLARLQVTPAGCRAAVHGAAPAPPATPGPVPVPSPSGTDWRRPPAQVPLQRQAQQPPQDGGTGAGSSRAADLTAT